MGAPLNKSAFPYQFDQSISKMFYGGYADIPSVFDKTAKISNFPKGRTFTQAELSPLGALRQIGEGEEVSFDVPAEGHKKSIQTVKFGLGFQVTEEAMEDDYQGQLSKLPQSLARSASYAREVNFANLFNNAFSTTTGWDGKAVFATDHATMKSGTVINNLGAADLSPTSFEAAFNYFDTLVDEAGLKIMVKPNQLLIAPGNKWVANDLLKATGRVWDYSDWNKGIVAGGGSTTAPGSNSNMPNHFDPNFGIVDQWGVVVNKYLTDDDAWFLLAPEHTFSFYWKKQPTISSSDNFGTDSKLYKVTMRFATAVWDYKPAYGSPGA